MHCGSSFSLLGIRTTNINSPNFVRLPGALNNLVIQCKAIEVYHQSDLFPINFRAITNRPLGLMGLGDGLLSLMHITATSLSPATEMQIPFHLIQQPPLVESFRMRCALQCTAGPIRRCTT